MKYLIYGAGQTGRGHIPKYLDFAQDQITFVDPLVFLCDMLNQVKTFQISFPQIDKTITVEGYTACLPGSPEEKRALSQADYVMTAVGAENLPAAAQGIAAAFEQQPDRELWVITHENSVDAGALLQRCFDQAHSTVGKVKVAQSAVFCSTIGSEGFGNPLDIVSENQLYYPFEHNKGVAAPPFTHLERIDNFDQFLKRKIYTYNCLSAVIGYLGYLKGYTILSDAANDPDIVRLVDKLLEQMKPALAAYFGVNQAAQAEFAQHAVNKFQNRYTVDSIERNIRTPLRKLGPDERIMAPRRILKERHRSTEVLELTAAAALRVLQDEQGLDEPSALRHFAEIQRLSTEDETVRTIGKYLKEVSSGKSISDFL